MITEEQISFLAKKEKIHRSIVFREYIQLLFLQEFYSYKQSKKIFFKGGTALRLICQSPRFSEDLDFTVEMPEKKFLEFLKKIFKSLSSKIGANFKEKKTLAGKRFLMSVKPSFLSSAAFVKLDFSFREKVIEPKKSVIKTNLPILFTSYVYHLSKQEIFAEKIRALATRAKGRDLYDLWFLLEKGASFNEGLVKKKLKYYNLEDKGKEVVLRKIKNFPKKKFILDIQPFVSSDQRKKLGDFFDYVKDYLIKELS